MNVSPVRSVLRCLGALPFRAAQALGALIGGLHWLLPNRLRAQAQANIERCYGEHDARWRRRLLRDNLIATGRTFAEAAWFWQQPRPRGLALVREVHGYEHVERARAAGRGILFATPHIGAWELSAAWVAARMPLTVLYRPPRRMALDGLIRRGRERLGMTPVPIDARGIRRLHRALRAGEAVGLLPDQRPHGGGGVEAPFMGCGAPTMTLLSRMAASSGAPVIFAAMVRRDGRCGFDLHFWPADECVADADAVTAATCINREVERAIEYAPAQYMWNYRRFRRHKRAPVPGAAPE